MTSCNQVTSPGIKDERSEEAEVPLAGPAARLYRRTVARLNYLAQDRADLAFTTKAVACTMSAPSTKDVLKLKRILRYVRGHPRGRLLFERQKLPVQLVAQVDSDWAGCTRTRRSTSVGTLRFGKHCQAHWSRTRASVALSSGEAELNGALKGGCELLRAQHVCTDFGLHVGLKMHGYSAACRGMLHREGVGRLMHLEVKQMWLQVHIASGKIRFRQVPREQNTADAFTKHWTSHAAKHFAGKSSEASGVDSACGGRKEDVLPRQQPDREAAWLRGGVEYICRLRSCCTREPAEVCPHLMVMTACSKRPQWARERRRAKGIVRPWFSQFLMCSSV